MFLKSAALLSRNGVGRQFLLRHRRPLSVTSPCSSLLPKYYDHMDSQQQQMQQLHQNRTFRSAARAIPKAKEATPTKKRRTNNIKQGASSGRIAFKEDGSRKMKKTGMPKLCSGCGVEIISSSSNYSDTNSVMESGQDAIHMDRTKRQEKKARYADIFDREHTATSLCQRCKSLQGGNVMAAYDALKDVDASVFTNQLAHVVQRRKFGLCIVVVDATDPEFSSVRKLRDIIKSTPAILVINKADLLPKQLNRYELNYLKSRVESGRTRVLSAYAVSSQTGSGLVELAQGILSELGGKDVFVVGAANVGKSTLMKSLSSLLARTLRYRGKNKYTDDKRKDVLQNLKTTQSHLPGTTLQAVRIPCFPSTRHALWDTPGIINRSALAYSLFTSHLMEPLAYPSKIDIPTRDNKRRIKVKRGYSILIEAGWVNKGAEGLDDGHDEHYDNNKSTFTLARLDVMEDGGHAVDVLAFIPSCLDMRVVKTNEAPTAATIPEKYLKRIQNLVGDNYDMDTETSRPLDIFKGGQGMEEGIVNFHSEGGWVRQDIVFASLGWIMLNHRQSFSVRPWCVKDSLWSKRRALYPSNLEHLEEEADVYDEALDYDVNMKDDDPEFEDIKSRLQRASDDGRTKGGVKRGRLRGSRAGKDYEDSDWDWKSERINRW